jgi:hypothetical protein
MTSSRLLALLLLAGLAAGCSAEAPSTDPGTVSDTPEGEVPPAVSSPEAGVPAGTPDGDVSLTGLWTVVSHHAPGVSAMSDAEARDRYGRTIRLMDDGAYAIPDRCTQPVFTERAMATADLLADYRLTADALPPLAGTDTVRVLETRCYDSEWRAPGSRLIGIDSGRALVPWDGVFFEALRDTDERAVGQEPFWNLQILKGRELRFTFDLGERVVVVPDSGPVIDDVHGVRQYHDMTDVIDLRAVVQDLPCEDAMSGEPYPYTVSVTLNGRSFDGCGGPVD